MALDLSPNEILSKAQLRQTRSFSKWLSPMFSGMEKSLLLDSERSEKAGDGNFHST